MINTVHRARKREADYHRNYYSKHKLGDTGTWLIRPAQYAINSFKHLQAHAPTMLDLGCGIGRHLLPFIDEFNEARAVGLDILPEAIEKLDTVIKSKGLTDRVRTVSVDIAEYNYGLQRFDLVLSISCLEHTASYRQLKDTITNLQKATKIGGVNCFMISTDVTWQNRNTGKKIKPVIEHSLDSNELEQYLRDKYESWRIEDLSRKKWSVPDTIDDREIINTSTCLQFTAVRV